MKRLAIAITVAVLLFWVAVGISTLRWDVAPSSSVPASSTRSSDPLTSYRANVGKFAYNRTNGVPIGQIVGVGYYQAVDMGTAVIVYKVDRGGVVRNAPVDNVDAR